ncbi:outer membrane protein, YaiO family [Maribacter sedimenticola]|uniref:Outer membrane protein, YaiO family n=1 Tax=Maribacter sedimenticola TaxID=228956 RepID=A0ABY1SGU3_9FLAO|nr:YaiO family outer membrane beta-barrel protein [Maribacter sedimenticola]SNR47153.1 outer membrane protein, YaiO family [Maribacter sedimenticola]
MNSSKKHIVLWFFILCLGGIYAQSPENSTGYSLTYDSAYDLAFAGKTSKANSILGNLAKEQPQNTKVTALWASTLSWKGNYDQARNEFNKVLSADKKNREAWISAIKNELYAKNYATALGLANKALVNINDDTELVRLKDLAFQNVQGISYPKNGWYNVDSKITTFGKAKKKMDNAGKPKNEVASQNKENSIRKTPVTEEVEKNRVAVNSSVTVFDQRFNPITSSSISFKRQTKFGSIIPRLNFSSRQGKNGLQYDIDMYPKIAKGFYAYVNYGYSNSELFPNHKVGGDVYYNHKSGVEFSGGGRFINFATRNVKSITNSLGYYRGNYYFSLRSFITPGEEAELTKASGNILVRKYLKDAENYMGLNFGIGFSPELRQFSSGDQLLAETLLYIESQRLSFEYQFTSKNNLSAYRTNVGVLRQEQSFAPGTYFYSFSAGLTYQFNF